MPRKKPSEEMSIVPESIRDMIGNRVPKEDRAALSAMAEEETGGYAKGGMVKKYAKGGLVKVRGYGKARSKPCKIC